MVILAKDGVEKQAVQHARSKDSPVLRMKVQSCEG